MHTTQAGHQLSRLRRRPCLLMHLLVLSVALPLALLQNAADVTAAPTIAWRSELPCRLDLGGDVVFANASRFSNVAFDTDTSAYLLCTASDGSSLLRVGASGVVHWSRPLHYSQGPTNRVALDGQGHVFVAGYADTYTGPFTVTAFDTAGTPLWTATPIPDGGVRYPGMYVTASGIIYIVYLHYDTVNTCTPCGGIEHWTSTIFAIAMDVAGTVRWTTAIPVPPGPLCKTAGELGAVVDPADHLWISADIYTGSFVYVEGEPLPCPWEHPRGLVTRLDTNGAQEFSTLIDAGGRPYIVSPLGLAADGSVALMGYGFNDYIHGTDPYMGRLTISPTGSINSVSPLPLWPSNLMPLNNSEGWLFDSATGAIYLHDYYSSTLSKFSADGALAWVRNNIRGVSGLRLDAGDLLVMGEELIRIAESGADVWRVAVAGGFGNLEVHPDGSLWVGIPNWPSSNTHTLTRYQPEDADRDGLPDSWERKGIPVGGLSPRYVLPGADPRRRDIYLELDAMEGLAPSAAALRKIVTQFGKAPAEEGNDLAGPGIALHIVGKNGCDPCADEEDVDREGWPAEPDAMWTSYLHPIKRNLDPQIAGGFGTVAERESPSWSMIRRAKAKAFRYGLFADWLGYCCRDPLPEACGGRRNCYGGVGELPGNDVVVTLGRLSNPSATDDENDGVLMHELGHTLGLMHGGVDHVRWKPNYKSVMNYLWLMPARSNPTLSAPAKAALRLYQGSYELDYSRHPMGDLHEGGLDEAAGLAGPPLAFVPVGPHLQAPDCVNAATATAQIVPMSGRIDWNRNGMRNETVCADANYVPGSGGGPSPGDMLAGERPSGKTDWQKLKLLPSGDSRWADVVPPVLASSQAPEGGSQPEFTLEDFDSLSNLRFDCNGDGRFDDDEIAAQASLDANGDGVLDECHAVVVGVDEDHDPGSGPTASVWRFGRLAGPVEFRFRLNVPGDVRVRVYDARGAVVATPIEEFMGVDEKRVVWPNGRDAGRPVPSGVYFMEMAVGGVRARVKFIYMR